jgi:hypothetical protein
MGVAGVLLTTQILKEDRALGSALHGTRNALFANHQEVQQHEDRNQPRQHKGVQAIEATQSTLTDAFTTAH